MYSTPTIYVSYIYNCTQKNNSASTQKNLKGKSKVPQLSGEKKLGLKNPINIMFLTIDDDPTSENEDKYIQLQYDPMLFYFFFQKNNKYFIIFQCICVVSF